MSPAEHLGGGISLHCGDCMDVLDALPENSVDAICCDPPYHLTSIVKRFGGDMPPRSEAAVGKHAYGRHARGFMGKQWDGGDIAFHPKVWGKALRVLKPGGYIVAFASTRGFGRMSVAIEDAGFITHPLIAWIFATGFPKATRVKAPGYDGFRYGGQALKPAIEPVYMGQKPFSEATGTENILRWGTGALNIDGCRVELEPGANLNGGRVSAVTDGWDRPWKHDEALVTACKARGAENVAKAQTLGRWPANVTHDGSAEVLAAFPDSDARDGVTKGAGMGFSGSSLPNREPVSVRSDSGSAARFFYSAKADADDRIGSNHPTVKPVDLMQWLCRLITPPSGTVLDPFAGTGTTGEAAYREGFKSVLIEREVAYQADIRRRAKLMLVGADERSRESIKASGKTEAAGPLFAEPASQPASQPASHKYANGRSKSKFIVGLPAEQLDRSE